MNITNQPASSVADPGASVYRASRLKWTGPATRGLGDLLRKSTAPLPIARYHERSSDHRPTTTARVAHNGVDLLVHFDVDDRYVVSRHTQYMDMVCRDSCVEFFVRPADTMRYVNFEFNCGGTLHCSIVTDPRRTEGRFGEMRPMPAELGRLVSVATTAPRRIDPEIADPYPWSLTACIPGALFTEAFGPQRDLSGQTWRANLYKCADRSSHPHWATWAPIGQRLDFHQPDYFGTIIFK